MVAVRERPVALALLFSSRSTARSHHNELNPTLTLPAAGLPTHVSCSTCSFRGSDRCDWLSEITDLGECRYHPSREGYHAQVARRWLRRLPPLPPCPARRPTLFLQRFPPQCSGGSAKLSSPLFVGQRGTDGDRCHFVALFKTSKSTLGPVPRLCLALSPHPAPLSSYRRAARLPLPSSPSWL